MQALCYYVETCAWCYSDVGWVHSISVRCYRRVSSASIALVGFKLSIRTSYSGEGRMNSGFAVIDLNANCVLDLKIN